VRVSSAAGVAGITPLVLTFNEAPNIGRCLARLRWAARIVVLDSGSTDETAEIVHSFPNAEFHVRPFDDHAAQWNHGLELVRSSWVLSLDADYLVPDAFPGEVESLLGDDGLDAILVRFRYLVFGRALRASLYPPRAALFRRDRCRYETDGHTQRLAVRGRSTAIHTRFDHDDRKPLGRWLESQGKYARLEADKLVRTASAALSVQDRLRRTMVLGPPAVFAYTLIGARTIFDGWPGWYYTCQRTVAEIILSLHLLERRLRP
jgi:glycosyltransferase involved in cell wall biosynthesis